MNYLLILNISFIVYVIFYFIIEKTLNEDIKGIDIKENLLNVLKKYEITEVTIDIKEKNRPTYEVIDKIIHINNKKTLKTVANSFHELGHAVFLKEKDFKENSILLNLCFYYLDYSFIIGVLGVIITEYYLFNVYIILFIKFSLIVGAIYLPFVLYEEYMASKIGYKNIKSTMKQLTKKQKSKIILFLINSFSSYFFFFLITVGTLVYYIM